MPLPAFPPSLRLKELQTKLTSLIPPGRLQEISWQDFWRSHSPRGASKNSAKDFCSGDLYVRVVCVLVANGSLDLAARAIALQAFL